MSSRVFPAAFFYLVCPAKPDEEEMLWLFLLMNFCTVANDGLLSCFSVPAPVKK